MTKWARTIRIKDLISEDADADAIKKAATGIAERLPSSAPTGRLLKAAEMADDDPEIALLVFNNGLDRIYDWADYAGVWFE